MIIVSDSSLRMAIIWAQRNGCTSVVWAVRRAGVWTVRGVR